MKNEFKEIEHQLRKSLEMWSDVMTESNKHGWGIELSFTDEDIFNIVNIMNSICANVAIKNGTIKTDKDAERVGKNIRHLLNDCFGIDLIEISKAKIKEETEHA